MSIVLPTSKEINRIVNVLTEIKNVEEQRLQTEKDLVSIVKSLLLTLMKPVKSRIKFFQGDQQMPGTMTDIQTITASVTETDAAGQKVTVDPANLTWSAGDPTLVNVAADASTGIATFTYNSAFAGTLPATTQVSCVDSGNSLTAQDTLTVNTSAATTENIVFTPPTP